MSFANQDNIDDQPAYDREVVLRAHAVVVSRSQASRSSSPRLPTLTDKPYRMMVRNELPPSF